MAFLDQVIEAHGGKRLASVERIEADIVTTGGLFPLKGLATDRSVRRMTAWLHEQRASVTPFGTADQRTSFTPGQVAIVKLDGSIVAESRDFAALFAGHGLGTPWGPLFAQLAENVGTSLPVRPKPLTQDQLLGLFAADTVGRNVVLEPATQFDMCGKREVATPSLDVVYDEV